jgi:hypothetical protein
MKIGPELVKEAAMCSRRCKIDVGRCMDSKKLYVHFDNYLTTLKLSASSRIAYRQNVLMFLRWTEESVVDTPERMIDSYIRHMQACGLKTSSIKSAQTALRHLRRCVDQSEHPVRVRLSETNSRNLSGWQERSKCLPSVPPVMSFEQDQGSSCESFDCN